MFDLKGKKRLLPAPRRALVLLLQSFWQIAEQKLSFMVQPAKKNAEKLQRRYLARRRSLLQI